MLRARHALEEAEWMKLELSRTTGHSLTQNEEKEILASTMAGDAQPVVERKKVMPVAGFELEDTRTEALLLMAAVEPAAAAGLHVLPVTDIVDVGGFSRFHPYSCLWCAGLREDEPCKWDCQVSDFCGGAARLADLRRARFLERYRDELDRRRSRAGVYGRDDPRANAEEFRRLADALSHFSEGDPRAPKDSNGERLGEALRRATGDDSAAIGRFLESLANLLFTFEVAKQASDRRDPMSRPAQHLLDRVEEDMGLGTAAPVPSSKQRAERILERYVELGHAGDRNREKDNAILAEAILNVGRSAWGRRTFRRILREHQDSHSGGTAAFDEGADAAWPFG